MKFEPGQMDMIMRLRSRGISDTSVLRAMETVSRRHFVDPDLHHKVYDDLTLPIACGQVLPMPLTTAIMTQVLNVEARHKVLEIGSGSGYHSALLATLSKRVYGVERYKTLVKSSEARFQRLGIVNVVIRHGDGRYGWAGQAPFDRIVVGCSVLSVPDKLMEQLAPGGVLVAVVDGQLTRLTKARSRITEEAVMPLNLPVMEAGKSKAL